MEVVFLVVIADILVGEPPEYHGLLRELLGRVYAPLTSRPLVLGALCAGVLLPLGRCGRGCGCGGSAAGD
jgi:hypothetical protein